MHIHHSREVHTCVYCLQYRIRRADVCGVYIYSSCRNFSESFSCCVSAPSQVSEVIKERVLEHSVQLSWQEPEHPNGVITEYEIKYYEKVSRLKSEK